MKYIYIILSLLMIFSCKNEKKITDDTSFLLYSAAFQDGGRIPLKYADKSAGGKNISIPLSWKNPPQGTVSFAILMIDSHPVADNFIHWFTVNIPAGIGDLNEGVSLIKMPRGSVEFINSYGYRGYGGMSFLTDTGIHEYQIYLYSLNSGHIAEFDTEESKFYDFNSIKNILEKYTIQKIQLKGIFGK
jgi:Raf kinase inhibitor-like YbhB/YbcL family protein